MTPHDHRTFVPGCYRCELGRDEVEGEPALPVWGEESDAVGAAWRREDAARMDFLEPHGVESRGLLKITTNDGALLVNIDYDLSIEYGPGYDPDEAARLLWESIAQYGRARDESTVLALGAELARARGEVERLRVKLAELADFIEANCPGVEVIGRQPDLDKWIVVT